MYPSASELATQSIRCHPTYDGAQGKGLRLRADYPLGHGITTQAETIEELRQMVRDAVNCFFDDPQKAPKLIRLHFVRDEVLAR